jgi:N-acetylmuramoyl-L-alanine amidase
MIPSPNYQSRGNARVRLVILHTSEGARDVTSLGNYLANPAVQASYHVAFDDQQTMQYVDYQYESWSTLSANPISDCGCCCGFAAWTRDQWLNEHKGMLENAAQWVAARCKARGLPIRRLSLDEVAACRANPNHPGGVIGHWDWTRGAQDGTHTDPGEQFPWDWVITRAQQIAGGVPAPKAREHRSMERLPATAMPSDPNSDPKTWPQRNFDVAWNVTGGWEGGAAFSFGGQDWGGRKADSVRAYLRMASWIMNTGKLVPVTADLSTNGAGLILNAHQLTPEYAAPNGCVGVTLNYAAPGEAYVPVGRSG